MIRANYSDRQTPQFRVLSDRQCGELYRSALECLQQIGVQVNNTEARDLLIAAGARADGSIVRVPPHLVKEALAVTSPAFTVWGRDAGREMHVAPDRVHFGPGLTSTYFLDPTTGERRRSQRGDPGMTARVADALPGIDYVMGLGLISDVQADLASVYEFAELLANTGKPIIAWAHKPANVAAMYRMAVAVAGSEQALAERPLFALFSTYPSPLRHSDEDLANLLWAAEHGIPVVYIGGPTVGIESPVTGASALVIHLATVLSGLTIVQLKRRGAAMAVGTVPSAMDMRTLRPAYGSPEMSLYSAAAVDLARSLGLPFMGTAGASESKLLDAQAGLESAIQVLMSALSGAALVHDVGFLDCADIGSLPMLVLTDEIISLVKRLMRGIEVNPETIMLDLIAQIGPGGTFLDQPRSVSLARREIWVPTLLDRAPYALWEQDGSTDTAARVGRKLRKILATHRPTPLPSSAAEEIAAILAEVAGE
ncbi:MAG: trimethylamine methyltransferase family protein [Chloroflexi bacterium]|nr:trimethylamine methyltransferase family protein [Chloroflexota bacterium]